MNDWITVGSVEGDIWDESAPLVGVYISKETNVGPNKSNMYAVKTQHGVVKAWGKAVLDTKMEQVPVGNEVYIEVTGTAMSKYGKSMNIYEVKTRPASAPTGQAQEIDPTEAVNAVFGTSAIPDMPLGA